MSPPTNAALRPRGSTGVSGYEYGNTRLRARRGALLARHELRGLHDAGSPERLLGALRSTAYGPDLERALVHKHVLHRVDAAVRDHLVRQLGDARSFYAGRPREGVELLVGRWDLRNLVAIVRARARPAADVAPLIVPAGVLDRGALAELERQPSLRTVVDLLVAWDLPSRETARRLSAAWRRFEETGEPIVLEEVLIASWAASVNRVLDRWEGTDLALLLRSEIDRVNLLTALRRRAAGAELPAGVEGAPLGGGSVPIGVLEDVRRATDADDVAATIAARRAEWSDALEAWVRDEDLSALDGHLQRVTARWAIGRFVQGDPLGIAIPIAFVWAKEAEAQNVRLVGRAIVHRLEWIDVEQDLVP
jgi:vacuolar-type H+-ATPase subunit C/Vma6